MRAALTVVLMMIVLQGFASTESGRIRADQRHFQAEVLASQMDAARIVWEQSLAAQVQANGSDAQITAPNPLPTTPACASPCRFTSSASYTITTQPSDPCDSHPSETGNDTSFNLQCESSIQQDLIAVTITAQVWSSLGGQVASSCQTRTYRIENEPPYFEPGGVSSCGANVGVALERDSGGCNPATPSTCDPTGATQETPTSTLDTAVLSCQSSGSRQCNGATPAPDNRYTNDLYQNGNQNTGWASR